METLKNFLLINALSSGATGLALVVVPGKVAELFNTTMRTPFVGTGLFLIAFAAMVYVESRRESASLPWVRFIILLDSIWVLISALIVSLQIFEISLLGYTIIAAVALWVGFMAALQYLGVKKAFSLH